MANVYEDLGEFYIPPQFGTDENDELTYDSEVIYRDLPCPLTTNWGASQFVITKDEWNYVYKIAFNGCEYYDNDDEDYSYFEPFSINYCEKSVEIYEDAEDAGVSSLFASMRVAGYSSNGIPIYVQPKAIPFCEAHYNKKYSASERSLEKAKEIRNSASSDYKYVPFSDQWIASVLDYYGEEIFNKTYDFIKDKGINDLHNGNYGYTLAGAPIIFDYCGFHD